MMKRCGKSWWFWFVSAIALSAIAGFMFYGICSKNGNYAEQLEADIKKELPTGTSKEQVRLWLISHHFNSWKIGGDNGKQIGIGTTIQTSGLLRSALIDVEFYFDRDEKLEKFFITRIVY